jgi:glycosyltransferase involved in cell wall biosynthesis
MSLSIVIPCLNDNAHLEATIRSIRDTAGGDPEIIVVDDCSNEIVQIPKELNVVLIRTSKRVGGGVARHIGALRARNDFLLFTDSHMRFEPGWFQKAADRLGHPKTVYCGVCLGLSESNMNIDTPVGAYHGAKLNYIDRDPNIPDKPSVLEGVWTGTQPKDDDEIECLMGAVYFWPRQFFLDIGGMSLLRQWGSEETHTSIKAYLCGGSVRLLKTVRVGHMFRNVKPYRDDFTDIVYNKLVTARVTMPQPAASAIESALRQSYEPRFVDVACRWCDGDDRLIQAERQRIAGMRSIGFGSLLSKFGKERFW